MILMVDQIFIKYLETAQIILTTWYARENSRNGHDPFFFLLICASMLVRMTEQQATIKFPKIFIHLNKQDNEVCLGHVLAALRATYARLLELYGIRTIRFGPEISDLDHVGLSSCAVFVPITEFLSSHFCDEKQKDIAPQAT